MAVRYEKIKRTKNSKSFFGYKKKKINKNSNPSGCRFLFAKRKE